MKKLAILIGILAVLGLESGAGATMMSSLTSNTGGMIGINTLAGKLEWSVSQEANGTWDYTYTFTQPDLSKVRGAGAIAIEFGSFPTSLTSTVTYTPNNSKSTSPQIVYPNLSNGLTSIDRRLSDATGVTDTLGNPRFYDSWLSAGTKVNVTTNFQGLQWILDTNPANSGSIYVLSINTELAPMYGDFYIDGYNWTSNNGYGMARNTGFDSTAPTFTYIDGQVAQNGFIPVPGSASVPIPGAVFLFAPGLAALVAVRRRKQK